MRKAREYLYRVSICWGCEGEKKRQSERGGEGDKCVHVERVNWKEKNRTRRERGKMVKRNFLFSQHKTDAWKRKTLFLSLSSRVNQTTNLTVKVAILHLIIRANLSHSHTGYRGCQIVKEKERSVLHLVQFAIFISTATRIYFGNFIKKCLVTPVNSSFVFATSIATWKALN